MALPEFSNTAMDRRFLAELGRLQAAGNFSTYLELAEKLKVQATKFSSMGEGGSKYHCNVKMLYRLRSAYPEADVLWVLLGEAGTGRPEPTELPVRHRGRPVRQQKSSHEA